MKKKSSLPAIAISLSLSVANSISLSVLAVLLVLSVHQAYASSCFTDTGGHWAETFICWMKTTSLSSGYPDGTFRPDNAISRAEVAALLYKEASGDTYINMGPSAWQVNQSSVANSYILYSDDSSYLRSYAAGTHSYQVSLPLITTLHNQQMTAKGVELCYEANVTAGGSITAVFVKVYDSAKLLVAILNDSTVRMDQACRVYSFSTPAVLASTDTLVLLVSTNLVSMSDYVQIVSAAAIQGFSPTAGVLAPSLNMPGPVPDAAP